MELAIEFIPQTDDGVDNATSFVSLEEANQLYRNHIHDEYWNTMTDDQKMRGLNAATTYLNNKYIYWGWKKDVEQRLEFPRRIPYYYTDGQLEYIIPTEIKLATTLLSENLTRNVKKFLDNPTINLSSSKADVLEAQFTGQQNPVIPTYIFSIFSRFVRNGR